jgi:hypothetical protein
MKKFFLSISVYFAYLLLLTPLTSSAETGYNSLFIGHSFFRPFAEGLPFHATQAGITGHQQTVVFSGGCSGAPQALWEDDEKSQEIKQVLDGSDIDLFGMTYCGDYNTTEGYENWINYALEKNPNTRIAIALPWLDYPSLSTTENYVNSLFSAYEEGWKNLIFQLKALYPGVSIFSIPHGLAAAELRSLFEDGNLPDVNSLTGVSTTSLFTDFKGHAGSILKSTGRLIWLGAIYDIDLTTYAYNPGYDTDIKAIANDILNEYGTLDYTNHPVPISTNTLVLILGLSLLAVGIIRNKKTSKV